MGITAKKTQLAATTVNDPRWSSIVARDHGADGTFYYAVKTTGVYCRPSCGARRACPEHVSFYTTCEQAEEAGFRPCKRCKPNQSSLIEQHTTKVALACRIIETDEPSPNLGDLARRVGISPYHFHRMFKQATGLTPKQYAVAQREKRIRNNLSAGGTVTDAILDSGYNSNSRFYEKSNQVLGMTPTHFRAGGINTAIHFAIGECSLGSVLVAQSSLGLCAILMGDDPDALAQDLQNRFPHARLIGGDTDYEKIVAKVVGFIEAPEIGLDLPLDIRGTAFQQRVWQAMCKIPIGETVSYADLASRIGSPNSARAVARACAANKLAVAIPCHRLVLKNGGLSGYRWGVERKRKLLYREVKQKRNSKK